ncbi:MAG: hypothetical protein EXS31_07060 [Pedosphaera sp.]|nr:hypothetical protein [Pedosphaera sp.]
MAVIRRAADVEDRHLARIGAEDRLKLSDASKLALERSWVIAKGVAPDDLHRAEFPEHRARSHTSPYAPAPMRRSNSWSGM